MSAGSSMSAVAEKIIKSVSAEQFETLKMMLLAKRTLEFPVVTGSMEPVLPVGCRINIEPLERLPEKFDIVVFWNGKILVCHYVWHVNSVLSPRGQRSVVTRPLAGPGEDFPSDEDFILGRVTSHALPKITKWLLNLKYLVRGR